VAGELPHVFAAEQAIRRIPPGNVIDDVMTWPAPDGVADPVVAQLNEVGPPAAEDQVGTTRRMRSPTPLPW
jgi:hypothetical protein